MLAQGPLDFADPLEPYVLPLGSPPPEESGPRTGFLENFRAGRWKGVQVDNTNSVNRTRSEAFYDVIDVLNEGPGWKFENPIGLPRQRGPGTRKTFDEAWAEMVGEIRRRRAEKSDFLKDVPLDIDQFYAWADKRAGQAIKDNASIYARADWRGVIGNFAGGVVGAMEDPLNIAALPFGGPGKTVAGRIAGAAAVNMAVQAPIEPFVASRYKDLGYDYGLSDSARSILYAGVGGAAIRGGVEAAPVIGRFSARAGGGVYDKSVEAVFSAAPSALQRRWADAGTLGDRKLAEAFRQSVAPDFRSPTDIAALQQIDLDIDLKEGSPFLPGPAGDVAYRALLGRQIEALATGRPPRPLPPRVTRGTGPTVSAVDRDSAVRFVMDRLEGGAKLVTDSGGLTKYGVSAKAHPGLDIASLTRPQAERIYVEQYWTPLGLDRQAPDVALVAFDAAINHGPGFARKILRESGGDPAQMLAMRRAEYARLIASNPGKYGRYEKGWENRLKGLEARLGGVPAPKQDAPDAPTYAHLGVEDVVEAAPAQWVDRALDGPVLRSEMFGDPDAHARAQLDLDTLLRGEPAPVRGPGEAGFRTAKGSSYVIHQDGTTTRDKAYRPEHGPLEQGLQPRSERTIYVDRASADKLGEIQAQGGHPMEIVVEGGSAALRYTAGPDAGKIERRTVVPFREQPSVGVLPVEIWRGGSRVHFGNEIVAVDQPRAPPARVVGDRKQALLGGGAPLSFPGDAGSALVAPAPTGPTLARFDAPDGEGVTLQVDSLMHDLKMDAEAGDKAAAAVLDEVNEEMMFAATLRGCL